jgi:hypothetical protein
MNVPANPVLCDSRDGLPIAPITIRAHDDRILTGEDLTWREWRDVEASTQTAGTTVRSFVRP